MLGNTFVPLLPALAVIQGKYDQHSSPINPVSGRAQSAFGGDLKGPAQLLALVGQAIETSSGQPASQGRIRITTATGIIVGTDRNGGLPTQYLTVILQKTGAKDDHGRNVANLVSVYPGCPAR